MNRISLLFLLSALTLSCAAQKYKSYTKVEGVQISTKWTEASRFKKDAPLQLMIKAENLNEYAVKIEVGVMLFLDGILEESSAPTTLELKAGQSLQGKLNGLYFESDVLSNSQIKSDKFDFEIELEVTSVE